MTNIDIGLSAVFPGKGGAEAPVIYVIDAAEHPFDIAGIAQDRACSVAKVCVRDWNTSLTPWPAPALYRGEPDFAGRAARGLRRHPQHNRRRLRAPFRFQPGA